MNLQLYAGRKFVLEREPLNLFGGPRADQGTRTPHSQTKSLIDKDLFYTGPYLKMQSSELY